MAKSSLPVFLYLYQRESIMQKYSYQLNYDEQSYTVMGYCGDETDITIPAVFLGKPVTILFDKLFAGHNELRSIVFPETITDFGEFLFDGCGGLRKLKMPSGLRNLWGYTFVRCGIEEIILPDNVQAIPPYAFKDCRNLKRVVCGSGMKKIYAWAFGGCDQLAEVVCAPGVEISPDAFMSNGRILRIFQDN